MPNASLPILPSPSFPISIPGFALVRRKVVLRLIFASVGTDTGILMSVAGVEFEASSLCSSEDCSLMLLLISALDGASDADWSVFV